MSNIYGVYNVFAGKYGGAGSINSQSVLRKKEINMLENESLPAAIARIGVDLQKYWGRQGNIVSFYKLLSVENIDENRSLTDLVQTR